MPSDSVQAQNLAVRRRTLGNRNPVPIFNKYRPKDVMRNGKSAKMSYRFMCGSVYFPKIFRLARD